MLRFDFPAPIGVRGRQLPVGLFTKVVSKPTQWTPAGASQVDLWALSPDRVTLHLFELKVEGNMPLGILPEALYYTRLLHYVRTCGVDGRIVRGEGELDRILRDERSPIRQISMWLSAPRIHPLLGPRFTEGKGTKIRATPLERLNDAMSIDGVQFSVAPSCGMRTRVGCAGSVTSSGPELSLRVEMTAHAFRWTALQPITSRVREAPERSLS